MIDPKDWKEADLIQLVADGVEESLELDYKACDALQNTDGKKNELSKDVSSFANSIGGTIVYGMREKDHKPEQIDDGYDPTQVTKEWLEQVINSRIHPHIDGLVINPVQLANGNQIYVVCLPRSDRAPHQASDKKYYKRCNFESVPMEDYEVRDVMFRQRVARVELSALDIREGGGSTESAGSWHNDFHLVPIVCNAGKIMAMHVAVEMIVPKLLTNVPYMSSWRGDPLVEIADRADHEIVLIRCRGPLFPVQSSSLAHVAIRLSNDNWKRACAIELPVIVYADNMLPFMKAFSVGGFEVVSDRLRSRGCMKP